MSSALDWLDEELRKLRDADLYRDLRHHGGPAGPWIELETANGRRRVLHLSGNSYLGLADDERVVEAAIEVARTHGIGAGASRLVTGGTDQHRLLEAELAEFKGAQDAALLSSGYLANLAVVTALVGPGDTIVSDAWNHASIIDACRLSGAEVRVHRHADAEHAEQLLRDAPGRRALITDGVFSMDGDLAPLPALCDAAERHGAAVIVDDAHGTGVVGPDGRGTAAALGCADRVDAIVVTLSKSLGAAGGAVVGSRRLVHWVRNRARPFIFDTALPAAIVAAARCALRISIDEPERRANALRHARRVAQAAREAGHAVGDVNSCIVPIVLGENRTTLDAMQTLLDHDVLVVAIRPPSVPRGAARLRVTTMATHTESDIDHACSALQVALTT
ncbi:MAG: 8-amino-7-oxononanoate synthase [Glaciecola sp.]